MITNIKDWKKLNENVAEHIKIVTANFYIGNAKIMGYIYESNPTQITILRSFEQSPKDSESYNIDNFSNIKLATPEDFEYFRVQMEQFDRPEYIWNREKNESITNENNIGINKYYNTLLNIIKDINPQFIAELLENTELLDNDTIIENVYNGTPESITKMLIDLFYTGDNPDENINNLIKKLTIDESIIHTTNNDSLWSKLDDVYSDIVALYTLMDEGYLNSYGNRSEGITYIEINDAFDQELGIEKEFNSDIEVDEYIQEIINNIKKLAHNI